LNPVIEETDRVSCFIAGLFRSVETVFSRHPEIIINREKQTGK